MRTSLVAEAFRNMPSDCVIVQPYLPDNCFIRGSPYAPQLRPLISNLPRSASPTACQDAFLLRLPPSIKRDNRTSKSSDGSASSASATNVAVQGKFGPHPKCWIKALPPSLSQSLLREFEIMKQIYDRSPALIPQPLFMSPAKCPGD